MLRGHGDDIYEYEGRIASNFSSNIYNRQDLSGLQKHLCERISQIHSYPEPDAHSLALLLSHKLAIDTDNICVTNGATEAIYLIAQLFSGEQSVIITPTFSEYEDACLINKHEISYAASLHQINLEAGLVVWMCNPNNPDGSVYHKEYLNKFIAAHPEVYFVVDQSYQAFTSNDYVLNPQEAIGHKNLILLHSMTKSYAIPGLRLGYITACKELIDRISVYRMPWSVNQLAVEAGKYLLTTDSPPFCLEEYLAETNRLMSELSSIDGLVVLPTNTHFFLCELIKKKAADLKQYLIENHGILIRDAANFRGLDEHFFRLATQSPNENNTLVKAIKEWI